jgi:hypothetical protein
MDLQLDKVEVPVGPYYADILAKDASGKYVVIENHPIGAVRVLRRRATRLVRSVRFPQPPDPLLRDLGVLCGERLLNTDHMASSLLDLTAI